MNLRIFFNFILNYYQLCGMCPISIDFYQNPEHHLTKQKNNRIVNYASILLQLWSYIHIVLIIILLCYISFYDSLVFEEHETVSRFNDIIKFMTVILTHILILSEGLASKQEQVNLLRKFEIIDNLLAKLSIDINIKLEIFYRSVIKKFIVFFVLAYLVEITIFVCIKDDPQYNIYWLTVIASLIIIRSRHMQQNLYIDMITYRFKLIKTELKSIVKRTNNLNDGKDLDAKFVINENTKIIEDIKIIKDMYNFLWEISIHINKSFGLSQLSNLMENFIQLTCDLYWIYSVLYKNNFLNIGVLILGLMPTFIILTMLLYSCEECLTQVKLIGYQVHNIEKDDDDKEFDTLIESFSLQIIQEPFFFSVFGFFNLDFTLLKAMVAAITTYMVIFIQFMPKEEVPVVNGTAVNTTTN